MENHPYQQVNDLRISLYIRGFSDAKKTTSEGCLPATPHGASNSEECSHVCEPTPLVPVQGRFAKTSFQINPRSLNLRSILVVGVNMVLSSYIP